MHTKDLLAIALFDEKTDKKIRGWKSIICSEQNVCDLLPPHLTLGEYDAALLAKEELEERAALFAAKTPPLAISFSHVGVFETRVCFAAPCVTEGLLGFHSGFQAACANTGSLYGCYAPGVWTPHCTLHIGRWPDMQKAAIAAVQNFVPFKGTVTAIAVGAVMQPLKIFALKDA